jgi:Ras homolog gene family, member A
VARKMGAQYIECSAKEAKGIDEVFELAINTAVQTEEARYEDVGPETGGRKVKAKKRAKCVIL